MTIPSEILVQELPDGGVRYVLPRRPIGWLRLIGLFPLAFGGVFAAMAVGWGVGAGRMILGGNGPPDWFGWLFVLFSVPFVVAGVSMAGLGLLILAGHSEVELRSRQLRIIEAVGPLRIPRRRPADRVRNLKVINQAAEGPVGGQASPLTGLACILAEGEGFKRPLLIAPGYPRDWLRPLADAIAERCPALTETGEKTAVPAVEVVAVEPVNRRTVSRREVVEQPFTSRAIIDEHPEGITITMPPSGLVKGTHGIFVFALIWCLLMIGMSSFLIPALIANKVQGNAWVAYLIIPLFWAVGIGLMLFSINMGRRQAVLAVVGTRLLILRVGPFESKRNEWSSSEIADVVVGPSGMEVNEQPVPELQIIPRDGPKVGLLGGRDESELLWVATRLRRALAIDGPH